MRIHQARGVDELLVLDIAATPAGRGPDLKMVESLTRECFVPLTIGGGVRSVEDVRDLLNAGADKVAIGTRVLDVLPQAAAKFGCQALVAILTVHAGEHADAVAQSLEELGAGEIVVQNAERDGTMRGYDLDLIREVSAVVSVPVVASCGCGSPQDMHDAIRAGASAVAAGAMFQFTSFTPQTCAQYLHAGGIEVRL